MAGVEQTFYKPELYLRKSVAIRGIIRQVKQKRYILKMSTTFTPARVENKKGILKRTFGAKFRFNIFNFDN